MSIFEYVMVLVSVVLSLGLTHLLSGFGALVQGGGKVKFSGLHALWAAMCLLLTFDMWLSLWGLRDLQAWSLPVLLIVFASTVVLYLFAMFVTPAASDEPRDLYQFHLDNRRGYAVAMGVYLVIGAVLNATLTKQFVGVNASIPVMLGLLALAWFVPARWAQWVAGVGLFATLAGYFALYLPQISM
ncbi:hypothetical protein [Caulobacter sp. 17J65-9]|uniref:hypothetical protein n=1 Tax=Caulobacter sp. 17J65-9 TaxID=2709382 RepID=UPI0013C8B505|nr:hypothetical protein [Caulobacter sp. 17J65-9]NEX91922.1 hypothetical protein [Caulobacter sp. 17J65-9]